MKIFEWVKSLLVGKYLGAWVRHALTALGGFILAQGIVAPEVITKFVDSGTEVVSALLLFAIGLLSSYLQKKQK